jgi:hypothetical protein
MHIQRSLYATHCDHNRKLLNLCERRKAPLRQFHNFGVVPKCLKVVNAKCSQFVTEQLHHEIDQVLVSPVCRDLQSIRKLNPEVLKGFDSSAINEVTCSILGNNLGVMED